MPEVAIYFRRFDRIRTFWICGMDILENYSGSILVSTVRLLVHSISFIAFYGIHYVV